jgi:hypothetical protein
LPETRTPPIVDGQREARCVPLTRVDVRRSDDGGVTVAGYAAVFGSPSEDLGGFVEEIKQGAFRKVLKGGPDVRFLINHDGVPLARTTNSSLRLKEDPRGLRIEAELADTAQARDLATSLERGDIDQMSFMFMVEPDGREWFFPDDPDEPARRVIYEFSELYDVSAVTFPAYPATEIGVRGIVCGEPIASSDGQLDAELFTGLCERVHAGEVEASVAERRELDRAAEQLQTVTPWQRERALRATGDEPEGAGAAAETPGEQTDDDPPEAYGLAARVRRLDRLERDFAYRGSSL